MREKTDLYLPLIPRRLDERLESLGRWSSTNKIALTRVYIIALLLFGLAYQLAYPITAGDTDMWYHLSGGQHFWHTGEVPNTTFFSFVEPERVWINYFWGFQALIYKIHELGGYQALVVFRALMFFCLTGAIALFLFHGNAWKIRPAPVLLIFILFFLLMEDRSLQVRPHLFSFLFIVTFLNILEYQPRWAPALPVLAVFWINTHGIEYVVGALICGAFFLEAVFLRYFLKRRLEDRGLIYLFSLIACAFAILLNPHGPSILLTPFVIPDQIDRFVNELQALSDGLVYPLELNPTSVGSTTSFTFLLITFLVALLHTIFKGQARLSHMLLALGGVVLLTKGVRFIWEWSLLCLPLLSTFANSYAETQPFRRSFIRTSLLIAVMCAPFLSLTTKFDEPSDYPLDSGKLPFGIVRFLDSRGLTGNLITPPSQAGYAQWELNPRVLIHSNMELPPFDQQALFEVHNAYRDADSLGKLISKYDIHFLSVHRSVKDFSKVISVFPQLKPVFFDDQQVLYANSSFFPEVVDEFQLLTVDPFNLFGERRKPNDQILELQRVREEFPEGERVNHALIRLLFWKKEYATAHEYARALASHHPRNPWGYFWIGTILENTARCEEAIGYFEKASYYANEHLTRILNLRIGNCQFVLKDFTSAYEHLSKGLNPVLHAALSEDLYLAAFSASVLGKEQEAIAALEMLLNQEDANETELRSEAQRLLSEIRSGAL